MNAIKMAVKFHELYEKYAPEYGYETKDATKVFNASSPNGKLMIRVCREIISDHEQAMREKDAYIDKMHGHKFSHRCHAGMMATITDQAEQIAALKAEFVEADRLYHLGNPSQVHDVIHVALKEDLANKTPVVTGEGGKG